MLNRDNIAGYVLMKSPDRGFHLTWNYEIRQGDFINGKASLCEMAGGIEVCGSMFSKAHPIVLQPAEKHESLS